MPLPRRSRPSVTGPGAGPDDVSHLSLAEVRDRLDRNERVLNSGLFVPTTPQAHLRSPGTASPQSTAAAAAFSPSRAAPTGLPGGAGAGGGGSGSAALSTSPTSTSTFSRAMAVPMAGPSRSSFSSHSAAGGPGVATSPSAPMGTSPSDPIRDRLLAAREQLLAREAELLAAEATDAIQDISMDDASSGGVEGQRISASAFARRAPVPNGLATSGKMQALEILRQEEQKRGQNGNCVALRFDESNALAARDFAAYAADGLSKLSVTASSSPKPRRKGLPNGLAYPDAPPSGPSSSSSGPRHAAMDTDSVSSPSGQIPPQPRFDPNDEIARARYLARLNAFMGYKAGRRSGRGSRRGTPGPSTPNPDGELQPGPSSSAMDEDGEIEGAREWYGEGPEVDEMFDTDSEDGHYPGEDERLEVPGPGKGLRLRGTGEEVDEWGENDERWEEDNDDLP